MSERHKYSNENSANGLEHVDLPPSFGKRHSGKVRDWYDVPNTDLRLFITTDRTSAFDKYITLVPGKGAAVNSSSDFWFELLQDVVPNHSIESIHPNVLIAERLEKMIPIEVIVRDYIADSPTGTSLWKRYERGEREMYGIEFPDGLKPNQKLPESMGYNGTIITPTTKAIEGAHDEPISENQAEFFTDNLFGIGTWSRVRSMTLEIKRNADEEAEGKNLIFADTKFEFGFNKHRELMVGDEIFTPDSSRIWDRKNFEESQENGTEIRSLDKDFLRKWLDEAGYKGEGEPPEVTGEIKKEMLERYEEPLKRLAGKTIDISQSEGHYIRKKILKKFNED